MRIVSGFTADAADPLGALEPFVPCFLANAVGNLTGFFSTCSSTASRIIAVTGTLFLPYSFVLCSNSFTFLSSRTRDNESGVGGS